MTEKKLTPAQQILENSMRGASRDDFDPRRFDWRDYLGRADDIIRKCSEPVQRGLVDDRRRRRTQPTVTRGGVDLRPKREELARLLAEAREVYRAALDDWETRRDPAKPDKRLERNWDPAEPTPGHDYSRYVAEVGDGFPVWYAKVKDEKTGKMKPVGWWQEVYYHAPGGTGEGRTKRENNLPIAPLHPVWVLLERWWRENVRDEFSPRYPVLHKGLARDEKRDMLIYQPSARFLLLAVKTLNRRYSATNCEALRETRKKWLKEQRKKARERSK